MAPFVNNDHSIHEPVDDILFLLYGPLFKTLKAKHWVSLPNVVKIENNLGNFLFFKKYLKKRLSSNQRFLFHFIKYVKKNIFDQKKQYLIFSNISPSYEKQILCFHIKGGGLY